MDFYRRRSVILMLTLAVAACGAATAAEPAAPHGADRFEKRRLTWQYWSEGDDSEVYTLEHFFSWVHDFNGDGRPDILVVPAPTREVCWFENPGRVPEPPEVLHWKKHTVLPRFVVETSVFQDITGDGRPELVCGVEGRLGYARPAADPTAPWEFVPVTPPIDITNVVTTSHGLGVGDVDGDGRLDMLRPDGWWQQPASGTEWVFHRFVFTPRGGGDMYAYDVNGDGLADVITSINAHGWGLSWFEQVRSAEGTIGFREHEIMGKAEDQPVNPQGVQFSQLHAVAIVDLDGDGLKDILTGKTFLAHENGDAGIDQPPLVCCFRLVRRDGKAEFVPEVIDVEAGIGRRIDTADIDGNGTLDVAIGNKKGCTLFLQRPSR